MTAASAILFDRVQAFLERDALPFWASVGAYDNGCFVEHLDLNAKPVDPGFTRVRAQARQIYVYSHAHQAGLWQDDSLAARAEAFFIKSCWLGPDKGWARRITRTGEVLDATPDLYDISFALFALAWRQRVAPTAQRLELAHQTLDFINREMATGNGGYFAELGVRSPLQQNPHMHLTESMNAWFEASGDARFAELAGRMVDLMEQRFSDPKTGVLGEFFNESWAPLDGRDGQIVEPGHQFEWAWIISHFGRLTGASRPDLARRLIASAGAGYDAKTFLTIDQVDRSGAPLQVSRRLWPQTESLKAVLAQAEFLGLVDPVRIAGVTTALFENYLDTAPVPGTWIDHYNADGSIKTDKIPSTSLYHIQLAFLDLLRLKPQLS
jgi:N-acylglucosamine 2-epimerase/mannose-6-phosphate isomerase